MLRPGLLELADRLPKPHVIIGGIMVYLHGARAGRQPSRVTEDVDFVFDVRAENAALREAVAVVEELGYTLDGMSADLIAHRYVREDGMKVDLLAPNKLGEKANLTTTPPGRTVEVPGGRAALNNRSNSPRRIRERRRRSTCRTWPEQSW